MKKDFHSFMYAGEKVNLKSWIVRIMYEIQPSAPEPLFKVGRDYVASIKFLRLIAILRHIYHWIPQWKHSSIRNTGRGGAQPSLIMHKVSEN